MKAHFLFVSALLLLSATVPGVAAASSGPVMTGIVADNGTLMAFWYQSPAGQLTGSYTIIHPGDTVQTDTIQVSIYAPDAGGNITLSVEQYQLVPTAVFVHSGNATVVQKELLPGNIVWDNQTLQAPYRTVATDSLQLPVSSGISHVRLSYDGASIVFLHHTSPIVLPLPFSGGGVLGVFLGALTLGSIVWMGGTGTAISIIRRAKYWPRLSSAQAMLIVFGGMAAFVFLVAPFFYSLGYLSWYWWIVPFYFVSVLIMLNLWPSRAYRWETLQIQGNESNTEMQVLHQEITVAKTDDGWERIHPYSYRHAIARLFGIHTKLRFERSGPVWYMRTGDEETLSSHRSRKVSRIYLLPPMGDGMTVRWSHLGWKGTGRIKRPGIIEGECIVPISGEQMRPVASVLAGLINVNAVSRDRETIRTRLLRFQAQLHAGAVKSDASDLEIYMEEFHERSINADRRLGSDDGA